MSKNILVLMTDQHRADYIGYLPHGKVDTPNINYIAQGTVFTNCQTTNPICTPARASFITGRYPRQVGMVTMSGDLDYQIPTLTQALQGEGYTTYGVGKFHFLQTWKWGTPRGQGLNFLENVENIKKFGFDHVWETAGKQQLMQNYCFYSDYLNSKGLLEGYRNFVEESGGGNGDTVNHNYDKANPFPYSEGDYIDVVTGRVAREYLREHPEDKPFYMYVSFCGPHKPYDPPKGYLDKFEIEEIDDFILEEGQSLTEDEKMVIYRQRRATKAMIKLIDDEIGQIFKVLEQRDMMDNTLIVFTSDHGDMLGDHGLIQKGVPWKASTNIPLAMKLPEVNNKIINNSPVELTDITATILDYAGLDPCQALSRTWPAYNDRIPGRSLLGIMQGHQEEVRDFTFSESDFTEERIDEFNKYTDQEYQTIHGKGRNTGWQMIQNEMYKYIKYMGYRQPGEYHEELYDLYEDPDELKNVAGSTKYRDILNEARQRLMFVLDSYPPAQKTWTIPPGRPYKES